MMSETIRIGCDFFDDLATIPDVKSALMKDRRLSQDEFATQHTDTIRQHYTKIARVDFLPEDAFFFASCIWKYLNSLDPPQQIKQVKPIRPSTEAGFRAFFESAVVSHDSPHEPPYYHPKIRCRERRRPAS